MRWPGWPGGRWFEDSSPRKNGILAAVHDLKAHGAKTISVVEGRSRGGAAGDLRAGETFSRYGRDLAGRVLGRAAGRAVSRALTGVQSGTLVSLLE